MSHYPELCTITKAVDQSKNHREINLFSKRVRVYDDKPTVICAQIFFFTVGKAN